MTIGYRAFKRRDFSSQTDKVDLHCMHPLPSDKRTLMWKALILTTLVSLWCISLADEPAPAGPVQKMINSDEAAIRAARTDYNKAIASRDIDVISRYWLPDSHSVWANGELAVGHDNIVARYAKTFKDGSFLSGLRTPQHIEVANGGRPDAAELGTWKWKMHYSGQDVIWRGRYLAMWHKVDGQWGLRSDLYVVTRCTGGSACR
jgi:ketosteroid isomerase-like protein